MISLIVFIIILIIAGYSFRVMSEEMGLKSAIGIALAGLLVGGGITYLIIRIGVI